MPQDSPLTALQENDVIARQAENTPINQVSQPCPCKTENIIVIGSELYYNSFWLKMMFVAPSFSVALGKLSPPMWSSADKTTVLYIPEGYSRAELLALDYLRDHGCTVKALNTPSDFTSVVSTREQGEYIYKIKNMMFCSHGLNSGIHLNFKGDAPIVINNSLINSLPSDAFDPSGRIYSYACRTGVSVNDFRAGFSSLEDAKPEDSLAQTMADHFNVKVHAFYMRTYFKYTLRDPSVSDTISAALRTGREGHEGEVVQIPPDHEALPHDGLADTGWDLPGTWFDKGPRAEGTNNYALWRKDGARALPIVAQSPRGLPAIMHVFEPA